MLSLHHNDSIIKPYDNTGNEVAAKRQYKNVFIQVDVHHLICSRLEQTQCADMLDPVMLQQHILETL